MVTARRTARGPFGVANEDDEYFPPIPLAEDDIRQFSVSVPRLVAMIREQNGIQGDGDTADAGMIPLGQKRLGGYGVVDVYLSLPNLDLREFASRCLSLVKPVGTKKLAVLLPSVVRLPAQERQLLDARGIVLIGLAPIADGGSLVVDWENQVIGPSEDRTADGVYAADALVWRGREYRCDPNHELTKREIALMSIALQREDIPLSSIIHRGKGAFWKQRFNKGDQKTRDRVTQMVSRLNSKLGRTSPSFPFFLSLPRNGTSVVRSLAGLL